MKTLSIQSTAAIQAICSRPMTVSHTHLHAIEDAEAWHKIQDVLEERAKAGVEVRVFYDDMGSIGFINIDFVKKMEAIGCLLYTSLLCTVLKEKWTKGD